MHVSIKLSENVYLMLVQGYKYVSIAGEEDEAKKNVLCFIIVFSYHSLQLGTEIAIIFFIVHNFFCWQVWATEKWNCAHAEVP